MLAYRHAFHAGNHADVLKHVVLMLVLRYMNGKDKPYRLVDTHAGAGGYSLEGRYAQKKGAVIDPRRHKVLKAPHSSPLSAHRGFIGCGHFSAANEYLARRGQSPIDWALPAVSA